MKTLHCTACQALIFFENTHCLNCGKSLAYLADRGEMLALTLAEDGTWRSIGADSLDSTGSTGSTGAADSADTGAYKLCENYATHNVCNWALAADDPATLCRSCRLTRTIPDLSAPDSAEHWAKLEMAKRRLVYGLLDLRLPVSSKWEDPQQGVEFHFLSDSIAANGDRSRVLTGHDNGVITINVAEADDVYRETQRQRHHEPYRTLLGHFRHEIGHYYWDRLINGGDAVQEYRRLFGDERTDYAESLSRHYEQGPPADWANSYISAYATAHPWEDWAESWAHFMHMTDALETAHSVGLSIQPLRADDPALLAPARGPEDFDQLMKEWSSLTYALNNLTRGLGLADAYPFILSDTIIEKLRFVHDILRHAAQRGS